VVPRTGTKKPINHAIYWLFMGPFWGQLLSHPSSRTQNLDGSTHAGR
jgi:hypothetical protein